MLTNRQLICLILLISIPMISLAQDSLQVDDIRTYTYELTIVDKKLGGKGAHILKEAIDGSQFAMLGENHWSARLGAFTEALLPILSEADYAHMAVETGPYAAELLMTISDTNYRVNRENLRAFYRKYANRLFMKHPIEFFHGEEDADLLARARQLGFSLWGLDQEAYHAAVYLMDEMLKTVEGPKRLKALSRLKRKALRRFKHLNLKSDLNKKFPRSCHLLKDEKINAYFQGFAENNTRANKLINLLQKSWEIFCWNESGDYRKNNQGRADYMWHNFLEQYQAAGQGEKSPNKVFVKLGSMHTTRGKSRLGVNDMGKRLRELAAENNYHTVSIRQIRRFFQKKAGKRIQDYLNSAWGQKLHPILALAKQDEWVLIDVRPLREAWRNGTWTSTPEVKWELFSYDFLLLSPVDRRVVPN